MMRRSFVEPLETRIAPAGLNNLTLTNLNGLSGFVLKTTGAEGLTLGDTSAVGDVNNDGIDDLLVALPGSDTVALIFGKRSGFSANLELGSMGTAGVLLTGEQAGDNFGAAVAAAGDVNGDGIADFIIGAPGNDGGGSDRGAAYIVYGRATWPGTLAVSSLTGANGFKVTGATDFDQLGKAVGGAYFPNLGTGGDFNGDGFADVLIGAPESDLLTSGGGAAFVVFGKAAAFTTPFSVSALTSTTGFAIGSNLGGEKLGSSVSLAGDINGDGFDDIVIGQFVERAETDEDRGFVIFGRSAGITSTIDVNSLSSAQGFVVDDTKDENFGSLPQLVDFDGDGKLDLVTIYEKFYPKRDGFDVGYVIAKNKGDGFEKNPFEKGSGKNLKRVVQVANNFTISFDPGDFNGDGIPDIVVDSGETPRANLFFGKKAKGLSIMRAEKDEGISFAGLDTGNEFDNSVNFIGDINGDGLDDLIVRPPQGLTAEKAYIVFGSAVELKDKARSASFIDVDGDRVTVKVSKGALDFTMLNFSTPESAVEGGKQLDKLDLTFGGADFAGANITISVKKAKSGDGLVNVGSIDGTGIDLGNVKIKGRLGTILAGDNDFDDAGLKQLDVQSFGRVDDAVPVVDSQVRGAFGSVKVKQAWNKANLTVMGNDESTLKSLSVGGSFAGNLTIAGMLGAAKLGDIASGSLISATAASSTKTSFSAGIISDGATISLNNTVSKLAAVEIQGAIISADRIDSLSVTGNKKNDLPGNFGAMLTLDNAGGDGDIKALGKVKIAGSVSGARIAVAGTVGDFSAAAIVNSSIFVGFTPTNADNPLGGGTFLADAKLGSLSVDGKTALGGDPVDSDDSFVVATVIGSVSLPSLAAVDGTAWGFAFQDSLKSLKIKAPAFTYDPDGATTQSVGDFRVIKLVE